MIVIATFYRTAHGVEQLQVYDGYEDNADGRIEATLDVVRMRANHRKLCNGPAPVMQVVNVTREKPLC